MISIIMPTFNRAHFLPRAIKSVLNQDFSDWELIIVDDGSIDNTRMIVNEFLGDKRIRYIFKDNTGATHSRNVGVEGSKGNYITFLDSDDEAKPNWLNSFNNLIESEGAQVMCCGFEYWDHNNNFLKEQFPKPMGSLFFNRVGRFTNGGVFMLEKELFNQAGGYDDQVRAGQHSELAIRLFQILEKQNIKIYNLFDSLIKVHVHKGEKIRKNDLALYEGAKYVIAKHKVLFERNKSKYSNYLGIAAVSAARLGKYNEAKDFFYHSWVLNPFNIKKFFRWIISSLPYIRQRFWKKSEKS